MHGETAPKIVEIATALMVERGYAGFSYADVSEKIGIRKASIHHHFPTKAELAVAVLKRHRERLEQSTHYLDSKFPDAFARLRAYIQYWETCIRDRSVSICVAALMSAELPSLPEEVQTEVRLHFEVLSSWIERTLKAGVKAKALKLNATPAAEAQVFMATVHGAMLSARASDSCEVFRIVTTAALNRLRAPKP